MDLAALEERLGYTFVQRTLIEQAVTHRSHGAVHNERLEFLGDAILNCAVAHLLYSKYGRLNEGDLSRLRSNLVKQSSLADIAEKLVLSEFMRLGEGEMKSGGFRRPSILADTMEAIFGAIFVDQGFDAARTVIGKLFEPVLKTVDPEDTRERQQNAVAGISAGQADRAAGLHRGRDARRRPQSGIRGRVCDPQAGDQRARQRTQPAGGRANRRQARVRSGTARDRAAWPALAKESCRVPANDATPPADSNVPADAAQTA